MLHENTKSGKVCHVSHTIYNNNLLATFESNFVILNIGQQLVSIIYPIPATLGAYTMRVIPLFRLDVTEVIL